ncbi:alpha/beta hydrolase [Miltoncostaea marina]|uniref:alpha/beta hydrolase n=1 Tax=Miltoncostaea marina TaxID=2843215 RepID=UPI001C3E265E|nr:alpha/beta hydrolase [Miltoncostaea marina]
MSDAAILDGWRHLVEPGAPEGAVLLMLHGTGGDERDMAALGRALAPGAPLVAPRGRVSEGGMARFFSRTPADPFRFPDLPERIDELAAFVRAATAAHGLAGRPVVAVGYSNGANAAAALMLRHPGLLAGGALLRPMLPAEPPPGLDLAGTRVLVAAGSADTMIPPPRVEALVAALRGAGADVQERWEATGHGLTQDDLAATARWLAEGAAGRSPDAPPARG